MQLVDTPNSAVITPQSQSSSYSVSTETTSIKRSRSPKLSMVWVQEFDGDKYRLVAKWVSNS
jgi:hypothetical protein